jgi:hypothetical protein
MAAMPEMHNKATIASMAVIAMGTAVLLHEGVGHGVTAWLLGAGPTELTSNHLSTLRPDRWVAAGGTLVNLAAGIGALIAERVAGGHANRRYFLWLVAALNLFPGAGYFMYSGVFGFGDWQEVIEGWPHHAWWRIGMTLFGGALYVFVALVLAVKVRPFVRARGEYNKIGRMPYLVACLFSCAAGALDPLGLKLFLVSTVPAAFGGSSGMLWLDGLMPDAKPGEGLVVKRAPAWWVAAAVFGVAYIVILGRGIKLG